jgi:hypothetical protein
MMPRLSTFLIAGFVSSVVIAQAAAAQSNATQSSSTQAVQATSAEAQTSSVPADSAAGSGPIAYVYVTRPTHLDGFAVSANGTLTPVPGSPFAGISLYDLSVTKHYPTPYLIGGSDDKVHILSYAIASNGSVKEADSVDGRSYSQGGIGDCCGLPQTLDVTGTTLYNMTDAQGDQGLETFHIESNGQLQFIGNTSTWGGGTNYEPGMISTLGSGKFAYNTGCNTDVTSEQMTSAYKRESSGMLDGATFNFELPQAKEGDVYCPGGLTSDPSNHLMVIMQQLHQAEYEGEPDGPTVLATYTADAEGNLTTKSTTANMPVVNVGNFDFSISPSGKLLAFSSGNGGFTLYHFNGADPITPYTGVFHSSESFIQFGWDKSNHLYALSTNALHIYSATSTKVTEEPGSPISIPEASSVVVLSLQ